jgi:L-threonylcarbamoyladenylate synthase
MLVASSMTQRIVSLSHPDTIRRAAEILRAGGLVVAPTETRYGLLARVDLDAAIEKLFEIKGRSQGTPTAIFVSSLAEMERYATVNSLARELVAEFLPGPLTIVLAATVAWSAPRVVDGRIGFRWSTSPYIREMLRLTDAPLTATSANRSGSPDAETVQEIASEFGDKIDLYIDGGRLTGPVSTVVECIGESCRILRIGAISAHQIEAIASR